ncbi:hypothetical protein HMPREF0063_10112 [Aeromicrobium marinum DSM 15272]|uniref:Uncharacterized protein n=1 Tax=Aeromicrobium marinum DSM 15272 TaxID=585531 RepID=E2S7V5_9ACTN|nr:hypothetical protein [Aeromicrobium marinum]EFQ84771.1 hypothetical protein HMPREF0063_10112 [Aeromicrobium marinum DSM 15272]
MTIAPEPVIEPGPDGDPDITPSSDPGGAPVVPDADPDTAPAPDGPE